MPVLLDVCSPINEGAGCDRIQPEFGIKTRPSVTTIRSQNES